MAIPISKYKDISFSSLFAYERVKMKGNVNTLLGDTVTITHGLLYVPYVRVWAYWGGIIPASLSPFSPISILVRPQISTLVLETFPNVEGTLGQGLTIYYRIYEDKAV